MVQLNDGVEGLKGSDVVTDICTTTGDVCAADNTTLNFSKEDNTGIKNVVTEDPLIYKT
jgi:hypothetical protein